MPLVIHHDGTRRVVKNLGWLRLHASDAIISRIDIISPIDDPYAADYPEAGEGEALLLVRSNRWVFATGFASLDVLMTTLRAWRNLQGVPVYVNGGFVGNLSNNLLGRGSHRLLGRAAERTQMAEALVADIRRLFAQLELDEDFLRSVMSTAVIRGINADDSEAMRYFHLGIALQNGLNDGVSFSGARGDHDWSHESETAIYYAGVELGTKLRRLTSARARSVLAVVWQMLGWDHG